MTDPATDPLWDAASYAVGQSYGAREDATQTARRVLDAVARQLDALADDDPKWFTDRFVLRAVAELLRGQPITPREDTHGA